jgi:hypothetical protein
MAAFTKREKDRVTSKARQLYEEMKTNLQEDTWGSMDPDDIAKRLVSMNCHFHGFNELSIKRMPEVAQMEVTGIRIIADGNKSPLSRPLRRPMKVPAVLLLANAKRNGGRYDSVYNQLGAGKTNDAPLLLPSPAGEMIGPSFQMLMNLQKEHSDLITDQSNMNRMLGKILPASKSVRAVCSVFPVIRHFLSPEMAHEIEGVDLTKARGDVHSIARTVDMGEMLGLSLKVEAYMKHRVPTS